MKRSAFHLSLPSDSSLEFHPNNTPDRFKVKLTPKIALDPRGNWEIGLTQFISPSRFESISQNFFFQLVDGAGNRGTKQYVEIPGDENIDTFLTNFNTKLTTAKDEMVSKGFWQAEDTVTLKTDNGKIVNPVCFLFDVNFPKINGKSVLDKVNNVRNGIYLNGALAHMFGYDEAVIYQVPNFFYYWYNWVPDEGYESANPKKSEECVCVWFSDLYTHRPDFRKSQFTEAELGRTGENFPPAWFIHRGVELEHISKFVTSGDNVDFLIEVDNKLTLKMTKHIPINLKRLIFEDVASLMDVKLSAALAYLMGFRDPDPERKRIRINQPLTFRFNIPNQATWRKLMEDKIKKSDTNWETFENQVFDNSNAGLNLLASNLSVKETDHQGEWNVIYRYILKLKPNLSTNQNDLWFYIQGREGDDVIEKKYLPNIRYKNPNRFLSAFQTQWNLALHAAKSNERISDGGVRFVKTTNTCENCRVSTYSFRFLYQYNTLPAGIGIESYNRFNRIVLSKKLAEALGITVPTDASEVAIEAQNYYKKDLNDDGSLNFTYRDAFVKDEALSNTLGIEVNGKYVSDWIHGYREYTNIPEHLEDASITETEFLLPGRFYGTQSERLNKSGMLVGIKERSLDEIIYQYTQEEVTGHIQKYFKFDFKILSLNRIFAREYFVDQFLQEDDNFEPQYYSITKKATVEANWEQHNTLCVKKKTVIPPIKPTINISCDLVSSINKNRNLLRSLVYQPDQKNTITQTEMSYPFFVPLQRNTQELEEIEIRMENEFGEPINFKYGGKTLVDVDIQPIKRKRLDKFILDVECQTIQNIQEMDLTGDNWEVAVVDILYPFTFENIKENEISINQKICRVTSTNACNWIETPEKKLPAGAYSTTQEYLNYIDDLIKPSMCLKKDSSGNYLNPVCLQFILRLNFEDNGESGLNEREILVEFSPVLANTLGVVTDTPLFLHHTSSGGGLFFVKKGPLGKDEVDITNKFTVSDNEITFPRETDAMRGFKIFYIYADKLIQYGPVGNVSAPLLRDMLPRVSTDIRIGEVLYHQFESLQWCPLNNSTTRLNQIEIYISDELGRKVHFVGFKKPKVTLAFRVIGLED